MKLFLIKISVVAVIVIGLHLLAGLFADGSTDAFYERFASRPATSMIIGTSRSAQALRPDVLNEEIGTTDLLNFSFTMAQSPYGTIYNKAILKKIDPATSNAIYILSVDPWSISCNWDSLKKEEIITEENLILDRMYSMSAEPNYEYLVREYSFGWGKLISNHYVDPGSVFLHEDGWLEVSRPMDSISLKERTLAKVKNYSEKLFPDRQMSDFRKAALKELILNLQPFGEVYLVRVPVGKEIYELENKLAPTFDLNMEQISVELNFNYMSFQNLADSVVFNDGNHLARSSSSLVSSRVGEWISRCKSKRPIE